MIDSLACVLFKLVGRLACWIPLASGVRIGGFLGGLAYWVQPKRVRIGYLNLKAALGDRYTPKQLHGIIRRMFRNVGAGIFEMLYVPAMDRAYVARYIELVRRDYFDQAVNSGRPVVLLTAHFGNWELNSITPALEGVPIVALARAQTNMPKTYEMLMSVRESKGCTIVHKGGALRELVRALKRGQPIGIVGDQASRQGLFINFFGRPALFAKGPFDLARTHHAWIVPGFIHRVRGPYHRLIVEPPIDLDTFTGTPEEVVRQGMEAFAGALERHTTDDPSQWLWSHKRWKYTPARRVVILSDGKLGHVKQSQAVAHLIGELAPAATHETAQVRFRSRLHRALAVMWAVCCPGLGPLTCLRWTLEPASYATVSSRYADLIISCGSSTAPVNVLLGKDTNARSIVIMNPAPIPLRRFHLALVPVHDRLAPRANVVPTLGALSAHEPAELERARAHLTEHPKFRGWGGAEPKPVISVLLGGDTDEYELTPDFADALARQVLAACDRTGAVCFVTTSRRTSPAAEQALQSLLGQDPRCRLLLLASRDTLNGTMPGLLGWAKAMVVTGDSVSMVSEACASGQPIVAVELPRRVPANATPTKSHRFLDSLRHEGHLDLQPVAKVAEALQRHLTEPGTIKPLDTGAAVRDALRRLL